MGEVARVDAGMNIYEAMRLDAEEERQEEERQKALRLERAKYEDQNDVRRYLKGEEKIDYEPSIWKGIVEGWEEFLKNTSIIFGFYEIEYPLKYINKASEMLVRCFRAKKPNLIHIVHLLEKGANPNAKFEDLNQQGVLHAAVRKFNLRAVRYLCEAGADVNQINTRHQTALMLACDSKVKHSIHIVRYLLKQPNINLRVRDAGGNSALTNAIFKEQPYIVRLLLRAGARALDEYHGPSGWDIAQFTFAATMYLEPRQLPPHFVNPRGCYYKYFDMKGAYTYIPQIWLQEITKYGAELNYRILQRKKNDEEAETYIPPPVLYVDRPPEELKAEADKRAKEKRVREGIERKQKREEDEMAVWIAKKDAVAKKVDSDFSTKIHGNMNDKNYDWKRDQFGEWHKHYEKIRAYTDTPTPDVSYVTSNKRMAGYKAKMAEDLGIENITPDNINWQKDKKTGNWRTVKGGYRELGWYDMESSWHKNQARDEEVRKEKAKTGEIDSDDENEAIPDNKQKAVKFTLKV